MATLDSFGMLAFISLISSQYTDFTKVVEFILKYSVLGDTENTMFWSLNF